MRKNNVCYGIVFLELVGNYKLAKMNFSFSSPDYPGQSHRKTEQEEKSTEYRFGQNLKNMLDRINKQRDEDDSFCDFTITVGDRKFKTHSLILSASSEYFRAMINSKMKEGIEKCVEIQNVSEEIMENILNFIYTGIIPLCLETIGQVIEAASFMQLPDLLIFVVQYATKILDEENCISFQKLGELYKLENLVQSSYKYLLDHFDEVSTSNNEFLSLTSSELNGILLDDITVSSETVVYEAVVFWVKYDLVERQQYFVKFFKLLRLQVISVDDMANIVLKENLVNSNCECLAAVAVSYDARVRPRFNCEHPRKKPESGNAAPIRGFVNPNPTPSFGIATFGNPIN
ncbi:kelch-like protein 12 [Ciona intestinalis]